MRTVISSLAIALLIAAAASAADCCESPACCDSAACCDQSHGCCKCCGAKKVCKVVCEMKEIKKSCWVVECEEFCPNLPGCGSGCNSCCKSGCSTCCNDPCAELRRPMVPPKCGKVRCRKKLVKKEITCEVPVYKCVVVCCNGCCDDGCGGCVEDEVVPEEAPEAPAPQVEIAPLPPALTGIRYGR